MLVISKIEFNNRIDAANLIPDRATKLQELIKINVDRQVFYEQMFIYTKQTIYDPAQKMDPKPVDFINNVFNASTNGPVKGIDVSLKQINKFYDELKTLDPAAAAESLKNKDKDYAAAKVTAKNRIMG